LLAIELTNLRILVADPSVSKVEARRVAGSFALRKIERPCNTACPQPVSPAFTQSVADHPFAEFADFCS